MIRHTYSPVAPLRGLIHRFWFWSDAPARPWERILPSGTIELVVNLREDEIRIYDPSHADRCRRCSGAVIAGPYRRFFVIDPCVHADIIGVHFRPGGAVPFLGVPASELADMHLDLKALWGRAARELRERLCEAVTPEARFTLLGAALIARLRRPPAYHPAVPAALAALESAEQLVSVRDVARQVRLSQRRFIQVFRSAVGMTPKRYHRIRRFQRARKRVQYPSSPDWADVALECGYFDQSHLIRDFQEFAGFSPVEFQRRWGEHVLPNHVPQSG
jgi:AraC-like DNA-binding protein